MTKIILLMPERLGDTVFTTPIFRFLKEKVSDVQVDVVVFSKTALAIIQHNQYIDNIIFEPTKEQKARLLNNYDYAFKLIPSKRYNGWFDDFGAKVFESWGTPKGPMHRADHLLSFVANGLGLMTGGFDSYYDVPLMGGEFASVKSLLAKQGVDSDHDILVGIHLGCYTLAKKQRGFFRRGKHKRVWPLKKQIKLAKKLRKQNKKIKFVLTGSKEEGALAALFKKKVPGTINLVNKIDVLELTALMSFLTVYITPDTGTLHVASATAVPIVALFGPSDPMGLGPHPLRKHHTVIKKDPIKRISVKSVYQAVVEGLSVI